MARRRFFLPAGVVVLVALCLRGPFAAVGPLLGELSAELSVPLTALAVLGSLPLVVFGLLSPVARVVLTGFAVESWYRARSGGTVAWKDRLVPLQSHVQVADP